jgi:type II secretory pathway pseudopilin PulG
MARSPAQPRLLLALLVAGALCAAGLPSAAAASSAAHRKLVIFSAAEQEQFINHQDDRIRGGSQNPFGNFNDVTASTKTGAGPFPGDQAIFSFNLFADPQLKRRVGTASFTCQYNFAKNAFCDAFFQLHGGTTLIANGSFNFESSRFTLAVTGGAGAYPAASGVLTETPAANHAQRVVFELT